MGLMRLKDRYSDRRWQRASADLSRRSFEAKAEADDVVKPVTHQS